MVAPAAESGGGLSYDHCWRAPLWVRLAVWIVGIGGSLLVLVGAGTRHWYAAPITAAVYATFAYPFCFRPYLRIDGDQLVIRNHFLPTKRIPRTNVRGAGAGMYGVNIVTGRDARTGLYSGTLAVAVTKQQPSARVRRGDLVCDHLEGGVTGEPIRVRQIGDELPPQPLYDQPLWNPREARPS